MAAAGDPKDSQVLNIVKDLGGIFPNCVLRSTIIKWDGKTRSQVVEQITNRLVSSEDPLLKASECITFMAFRGIETKDEVEEGKYAVCAFQTKTLKTKIDLLARELYQMLGIQENVLTNGRVMSIKVHASNFTKPRSDATVAYLDKWCTMSTTTTTTTKKKTSNYTENIVTTIA